MKKLFIAMAAVLTITACGMVEDAPLETLGNTVTITGRQIVGVSSSNWGAPVRIRPINGAILVRSATISGAPGKNWVRCEPATTSSPATLCYMPVTITTAGQEGEIVAANPIGQVRVKALDANVTLYPR